MTADPVILFHRLPECEKITISGRLSAWYENLTENSEDGKNGLGLYPPRDYPLTDFICSLSWFTRFRHDEKSRQTASRPLFPRDAVSV